MGSKRWYVAVVIVVLAFVAYQEAASVYVFGGEGRLPVAVDESSGLVASRINPGILWTHNDSGAGPVIFAISHDGHLKGMYTVEGIGAEDWEAITTDLDGHLYVGDFGNNRNERRNLVVYRVVEPRVSTARDTVEHGRVGTAQAIPFKFPEQQDFPPLNVRNYDAEALFWAAHPDTGVGTLYLLTKHRSDTSTVLYRFDDLTGTVKQDLVRVGRVDVGGDPDNFGGQVTGADISDDGQCLAVLTYHAVLLFRRPARGDNYLAHLIHQIPLEQSKAQQVEGIAWSGRRLIITNEQGRLIVITSPMSPNMARVHYPE